MCAKKVEEEQVCEVCGKEHGLMYFHCKTCMCGVLEVAIDPHEQTLYLFCPECKEPVAKFFVSRA